MNSITAFQIAALACVQGITELLPVSSSAHVILAEKLMGLDPTAPEMTLLLVMMHTGTMFAAIVFFRRAWRETYFASRQALRRNGFYVALATAATGVVGLLLVAGIRAVFVPGDPAFEIEQLFGNARLLGVSLGVAGILILAAAANSNTAVGELNYRRALWIGAIQGVCLPFRGFSRSGATISSGLLLGVQRQRAEEFSFALAVILTPAVVAKEGYRFFQAHVGVTVDVGRLLVPSVLGMVLSFAAGLGALCWLSTWLARGRWHLFGLYCLAAAAVVSFAG